MRTATVRELQHGLKDLLEQVQAGETFQVTRRGEVIAQLSPAPKPKRKGSPQWPDFMARLAKLYPEGPKGKPASEIIDEGRGERP